MLQSRIHENGDIALIGRLDAAQVDKARSALDKISASATIDFSELEYISSAGLGVLFGAQKRLKEKGHALRIKNPNSHIRDVFRYAGFDKIFEIVEEKP